MLQKSKRNNIEVSKLFKLTKLALISEYNSFWDDCVLYNWSENLWSLLYAGFSIECSSANLKKERMKKITNDFVRQGSDQYLKNMKIPY